MRQVVLASGKRATVSDEWIARWPEDIREVLDDAAPAPRAKSSKPRVSRGGSKKSAATKPPQKPAPEVPESNNSSVDEKKET